MLQLNDVSYSYEETCLLSDLTFTVDDGASVALCGPGAAGKSLLLALLAGELPVTSGTLHCASPDSSKPLAAASAAVRIPDGSRINQNQSLFRFLCAVRGGSPGPLSPLREEDYQQIESFLSMMNLEHLREFRLADLSDSTYRLAVHGSTVLGRQPHMFLDEPTAGLDPRTTVSLQRAFKKELSGGRRSLVFATSDLIFAARCADRIALLENGKLAAFGPVEEVLKKNILETVFQTRFEISYSMLDGIPVCVPYPAG